MDQNKLYIIKFFLRYVNPDIQPRRSDFYLLLIFGGLGALKIQYKIWNLWRHYWRSIFCPPALYEELPWGRGTGWKLSHSWRSWGGWLGVVKIQYKNWNMRRQLCQRGGLLVERLTLLENLWREIFLIIWETDFMDIWTSKIFVGFLEYSLNI